MPTTSYTIKSGDVIDPFTNQPFTTQYPVGTTIYGDMDSHQDYGVTPNPKPTASGPISSDATNPGASNAIPITTVGGTGSTPSASGTTSTGYPGEPTGTNPTTANPTQASEVGSIASAAESAGLIDSNFLNQLMQDPAMTAFYVGALAYGGYSPQDVLNDMKRKEMVAEGNPQAANLTIIDPEQTKTQYQSTTAGTQAMTTTASLVPTFNIAPYLDNSIVSTYGNNSPSDFLTTPSIGSPDTQTFATGKQDALGALADAMSQQINAQSEEAKAVADTNYANVKAQIQMQFGITLSNNATTAWNQVNNLNDQYAQNNLQGSGLENQTVDNYLNSVRRANSQARQAKTLQSNSQEAAYYIAHASPDEIKALNAQDQAAGIPRDQWRAVQWGLTPSQSELNALNPDTIAASVPGSTLATTNQIQTALSNIIDSNGNYYSTDYGNAKKAQTSNTTSNTAQKEYTASQDAINKARALDNPTTQNGTNTGTSTKDVFIPASQTPATTGTTSTNTSGISSAINKIQQTVNTPTATPPTYVAPKIKTTSTTPAPITPKPISIPSSPMASTVNSSVAPYTVRAGDTLDSVAARTGTTAAQLAKINNISNPNIIQTGQTIKFQ